jgi:hypothetical protein
MRIGTGDFRIGAHPIVGIGDALLGRQQGQQGRQGLQLAALPGRQFEHFAVQFEIIPESGTAINRRGADSTPMSASVVSSYRAVSASASPSRG